MKLALIPASLVLLALPASALACDRLMVKINDVFDGADVVVEGGAFFSEAVKGGQVKSTKVLKGEKRETYSVSVDYASDGIARDCGLPVKPRGMVHGRFFLKRIGNGKFAFVHLGTTDF